MARSRKKSEHDTSFVYWWCSLYIACCLIIMAVGQLFAFEDMPSVVASWDVPLVSSNPQVFASVLVILTVGAIPALLHMRLSPVVRKLSSLFGWVVLSWWLFVTLWLWMTDNQAINAGIFGAKVYVLPELWLGAFASLLIVMRSILTIKSHKQETVASRRS